MTFIAPETEVEGQTPAPVVESHRLGLGRWLFQPLICVLAVVGSLVYVNFANVSESEQRSLGVSQLLTLLRQHMTVSLAATILTCAVAFPLGILLTRGSMRHFSKPIITVAGFGQAAPAIGLIALGAVLFGLGPVGAIVALTVYGALPIVANTVTGVDGVDPRLVEAARGMGMSAFSTLLRVELPLALRSSSPASAPPWCSSSHRCPRVVHRRRWAWTADHHRHQAAADGDLVVGAILVAALALFIDWLARVVEIVAAPKGL